jgi:hypothetical protein
MQYLPQQGEAGAFSFASWAKGTGSRSWQNRLLPKAPENL